ncbi:MAG: transposase [Muribaculaceae bacterium]|nr:transposase [Muribaculaceae bacterium]
MPHRGRWGIERTCSWMENYRRLTRNYETLLKVAMYVFIAACAMIMLRYY